MERKLDKKQAFGESQKDSFSIRIKANEDYFKEDFFGGSGRYPPLDLMH